MSKPDKLSRALFDGLGSDKDPLGYGDSSTFDDQEFSRAAIYGMAPTLAQKKRKIKEEVILVAFILAFTIGFALVLRQAAAEDQFQREWSQRNK